ncbi:dihydroxyacetone kinase phosphoryl donor subunit DhaM [Levilactobacillus bambusae]|uniref:phosphoenolpyruvate--glycerone phosphotransferase n=1 Tax=Levilactobacillus bambusae TaxID=2024736 RepID=A0A2V1MWL2_9LACO|nr:dihydroxyacetone kinase phosphoryl donor subunit DhaM [Levilactobacillus bambusae]PWF99483.1 PTS mannose family transporter subunit IIA [Levilactobacillus bambusae]
MTLGIVIVSHVAGLAAGVKTLVEQGAADVAITTAGGTDEGEIGTSVAKINAAIESNTADEVLAFYDLGSAKMNLSMAIEMSPKPVHLYDVALVEGAYTAGALLQAGVDLATVQEQLSQLKIK